VHVHRVTVDDVPVLSSAGRFHLYGPSDEGYSAQVFLCKAVPFLVTVESGDKGEVREKATRSQSSELGKGENHMTTRKRMRHFSPIPTPCLVREENENGRPSVSFWPAMYAKDPPIEQEPLPLAKPAHSLCYLLRMHRIFSGNTIMKVRTSPHHDTLFNVRTTGTTANVREMPYSPSYVLPP
jgi:hypothetical protein